MEIDTFWTNGRQKLKMIFLGYINAYTKNKGKLKENIKGTNHHHRIQPRRYNWAYSDVLRAARNCHFRRK